MLNEIKIQKSVVVQKGVRAINENAPIDLLEYITPKSAETVDTKISIPKEITVSEKIHGTVYDVTGVFIGEANKTLFQQLKDLILSEQL